MALQYYDEYYGNDIISLIQVSLQQYYNYNITKIPPSSNDNYINVSTVVQFVIT